MKIGVPKEIKNHEYRVGLTPESVSELVAHGHEVWVETGAGQGIGDVHAWNCGRRGDDHGDLWRLNCSPDRWTC